MVCRECDGTYKIVNTYKVDGQVVEEVKCILCGHETKFVDGVGPEFE